MSSVHTISVLVFALALGLGSVACGGSVYDQPRVPSAAHDFPAPPVRSEVATTTIHQAEEETVIGGTEPSAEEFEDTDPAALTEFREPLAPYGTWTQDASYGTVWIPSPSVVGADFQPYVSAGHWAYENDYTWVSDYSWGWAPFHYGRWALIDGIGWSWIPGRRYAPAWVTWRMGPAGYDYVGWAPLSPTWYWLGGYAYQRHAGHWGTPRYVYCPTNAIFQGSGIAPQVIRSGPRYEQAHASTRDYVPASPTVAKNDPRYTPSPTRRGPDPRRELGLNSIPQNPDRTDRAQLFASPRAMNEAHLTPHASTYAPSRSFSTTINANPTYVRPRVPSPTYAPRPQSSPVYTSRAPSPTYESRPVRASQMAPTPSYAAPSYAAPSYAAPSYAAPSYAAPSYAPPSYAAPVTRQPTFRSPSPSIPRSPVAASPVTRSPMVSAPISRPAAPSPVMQRPSVSAPAARANVVPAAPPARSSIGRAMKR